MAYKLLRRHFKLRVIRTRWRRKFTSSYFLTFVKLFFLFRLSSNRFIQLVSNESFFIDIFHPFLADITWSKTFPRFLYFFNSRDLLLYIGGENPRQILFFAKIYLVFMIYFHSIQI